MQPGIPVSGVTAVKRLGAWVTLLVLLLAILLLAILLVVSRSRHDVPALGDLTIETTPQPVTACFYLADLRGYFRAEGVNVTLKSYPTGRQALQAMLDHGSTLVWCARNNGNKYQLAASLRACPLCPADIHQDAPQIRSS